MHRPASQNSFAPAKTVAEKLVNSLERFLHIEAASGIALLVATAVALIWANSPAADSYSHLWHTTVSVSFGNQTLSRPLHFLINDGLMTIFFLVVGLEIRRELHGGALRTARLAALPLAAALGGIVVPALIYVGVNTAPGLQQGWAIPTATDIAFALGVLALLGKSVPSSLRVLLLALAIVDDIAAILIIAVFYSGELNSVGLLIALIGIAVVYALQRLGVISALVYVVPGAVLWVGLLVFGVHPTLAGVILGLMTPVRPLGSREHQVSVLSHAVRDIDHVTRSEEQQGVPHRLLEPMKKLRRGKRELVAPVTRVQTALHPWVAYGIMPLFALANAGIALSGFHLDAGGTSAVAIGVFVGLVVGKPVGILLASSLVVRLGWCQLPRDISWRSLWIIGCLGGIGFTMSVFIANLAFSSAELLSAAKLGILAASGCAAIIGLGIGRLLAKASPTPAP
jgi:NhaA family Na+:H+ antiporter